MIVVDMVDMKQARGRGRGWTGQSLGDRKRPNGIILGRICADARRDPHKDENVYPSFTTNFFRRYSIYSPHTSLMARTAKKKGKGKALVDEEISDGIDLVNDEASPSLTPVQRKASKTKASKGKASKDGGSSSLDAETADGEGDGVLVEDTSLYDITNTGMSLFSSPVYILRTQISRCLHSTGDFHPNSAGRPEGTL